MAKAKSKSKTSLKNEMASAEQDYRKKMKPLLRKKFPSIPEEEIQNFIDEYIPLLVKALYKADTRAFRKLMNTAYGRPK